MKKTKVMTGLMLLGAAALLPMSGCEEVKDKVADTQGALCCDDFKVGGDITAEIGGSAESQVAVQAVADFAAIASAAITDVTAACRSMAQDLDAPKAEQDAAEKEPDKRKRMGLWCDAAVKAIGVFKATAGGTLSIKVAPAVCEASISAKANCQAKCSGAAECDLQANPPTCEGGKLEIACKGSCTASGSVAVACEGECTGECSGQCTAEGGVECEGKCEGTCEASTTGGGNGIQADGTCKGVCKGTCEVTAPKATCTGSCKGTCSAACKASAGASVKCDGSCDAEYEPVKCTGGELKGGCKVEAKCDANCDASVKAKAECRPPAIEVSFSGAADVQAAAKLESTFKANMGAILAFKGRLEAMNSIAVTLSGNVGAVVDIKAACIPAVVIAVADAVDDVKASVTVTVKVAATTQ